MLPAISTAQEGENINPSLATRKPPDYLDRDRQASRDSVSNVKLEDRLNLSELEIVKEAFENCGEEAGVLSREEFETVLATTLKGYNYGGDMQAADLFEKIDLSGEGKINLDQFCSYMLMYYYEKEDKVKSTQVPQWKSVRLVQNSHKEVIQGVQVLKSPPRYVTVSKDGCLCTWSRNLQVKDTLKIQREDIDRRDLWVTAFSVLSQLNKLVVTLTTKEILIYDITALPEFVCQFTVGGLDATPLSLCTWSTDDDPNESAIILGDADGNVLALMFSMATENLFQPMHSSKRDKQQPGQDAETVDTCTSVSIQDILAGKYKDVQLVTHSQHDGWVRKVKYYASLDAIISCGTTDQNSIVIAYIEKASNSMRTINFSVKQGVSDFDYNRSINLIVSAGVDRMIRLWNPYVTSKPVGLMEGHTSPVVAIYISASRGQVFSLCAQKVLRVWDIQLQACLQIVSGVFPRGPPVTTNMFFEEGSGRLFAMFNNQLCMLEIKPDVKNRVVSHDRPVSCVIYSTKFNQIITACADSVIAVWMLDTGQRVRRIPHAHGDAEITCMILSHSQQRFLTGATDGMIKIWDVNTGMLRNTFLAAGGLAVDVTHFAVVQSGIIAVGWSRSPTFFRIEDMSVSDSSASEWTGGQEHQDDIVCVAYCPPHHIATASLDGEIVLWNIHSERVARRLSSRSKLRGANEGRLRKTSSRDHFSASRPSPRVPSLSSRSEAQMGMYTVQKLVFLDQRATQRSAAQLVACGSGGWVRFWNIDMSQCMAEFVAHSGVATTVAMATDVDNTVLATGGPGGDAKLWDIKSYCMKSESLPPPCLGVWTGHFDCINSIMLVNRGSSLFVVTASADCCCCVWDKTGNQIGTFGQDEHWKLHSPSRPSDEDKTQIESIPNEDDNSKPRLDETRGHFDESNVTRLPLIVEASISNDKITVKEPPDTDRLGLNEKRKTSWSSFDDDNDSISSEDEDDTAGMTMKRNGDSVSVWDSTTLGVSYRTERLGKRPRKQPFSLPPLRLGGSPADYRDYPPGHPIVLGPEASPYQRLPFVDVGESHVVPQKPELLVNLDYHLKSDDRAANKLAHAMKMPVRQQNTAQIRLEALRAQFDEISLFPKNFWDPDVRERYTSKRRKAAGNKRSKTRVNFMKGPGSSRASTHHQTQRI